MPCVLIVKQACTLSALCIVSWLRRRVRCVVQCLGNLELCFSLVLLQIVNCVDNRIDSVSLGRNW